jgi:hypothetical protein
MPKYLISFEKGAMDHIPAEDFPEVSRVSHAVVQEAKDAGCSFSPVGCAMTTTTLSMRWSTRTGS